MPVIGQEIIMNDGSRFIVTNITNKHHDLIISLKPISNNRIRYSTYWSRLKELLTLNMLTIVQ